VWSKEQLDFRLDFGGDMRHDSDPGIFLKNIRSLLMRFVYSQPIIKHENPRRRFELSECFLFDFVYYSKVIL